jgi:hypothetical protein
MRKLISGEPQERWDYTDKSLAHRPAKVAMDSHNSSRNIVPVNQMKRGLLLEFLLRRRDPVDPVSGLSGTAPQA